MSFTSFIDTPIKKIKFEQLSKLKKCDQKKNGCVIVRCYYGSDWVCPNPNDYVRTKFALDAYDEGHYNTFIEFEINKNDFNDLI